MGQLDVMVPLEEEGERFLIPCMLPDAVPEGAPLTCEKPQWVFRRSYFMTEGKAVPIGVMGKMIANSLRWGNVVCVWKEGCVVRKDEVFYSVRRQKVPQRDANGSVTVVDGVHILISSSEGDFSSSHSSFMHFCQSVSNVLSEFYHISHVEVIPLDDDCTDWCTFDDIILSLLNRLPTVISRRGVHQRVDVLCEYMQVKDMVKDIPSKNIQLFEVLGEGSYCVVRRGEVISNQEVEIEGSGKGKEKEGEIIEVAVKILVDKKEVEGGEGDRKGIEKLILTNREVYLMGSIHHMNVVHLYGICTDKESPWVVMEFMRGGDLLTALTDPFRLAKNLKSLSKQFDVKYNENVFGFSSLSMKEALQKEILSLRCSVDAISSFLSSVHWGKRNEILPFKESSNSGCSSSISSSHKNAFTEKFEELIKRGERHWVEQTSKTYAACYEILEDVRKIRSFYFFN